jgi:hypothetical protein
MQLRLLRVVRLVDITVSTDPTLRATPIGPLTAQWFFSLVEIIRLDARTNEWGYDGILDNLVLCFLGENLNIFMF